MALYHFSTKVLSRSSRNTVRSLAYRAGCELYDVRTGQFFNYFDKPVQHVELLLPRDAPSWAVEIQELVKVDRQKGVQAFSDIVEAAEKRIDAQVYREFEFALPRELTEEQNIILAREFVEDQIASRGMTALLNFHFDQDEETGEGDYPQAKPHCHVLATLRRLEENGLSQKKERDWNKKELVLELRQQWQDYSNFHLKLHGHDIQIDHRSYKERSIEIEPQPKMGRGILEQEKKHQVSLKARSQKKEISEETTFATDKAKAFHEVQLRNLYRILRRPEIVFDIVTKHHATFMWADVQKVLHRYIDEAPLFYRVEAKLKNSKELLLLTPEGKKGFAYADKKDGEQRNGSDGSYNTAHNKERSEDLAIYTTRHMLSTERSLVTTAEELEKSKSHGVNSKHIKAAFTKANDDLKSNNNGGLSNDQIQAISHLVDEGQIKCVVGIAGAGKTTALGICHEIWKAEGYAVYGLAPTGKAAQNLDQNGIPSTTLHKFLKSFESGRCQYDKNSVFVLDEAGMVDVERFGKLLSAVKQLGVKLIVVGDGAQLQPVEAGPAFRLVTTRVGKVELNTVLRQNEEWQREATVLFGQQKTIEAITKYAEKGCVHIVEEKLLSLDEALEKKSPEDIENLYGVSHRVSALMYREMMKACPRIQDPRNQEGNANSSYDYSFIKQHQDYETYRHWKAIKEDAAAFLLNIPKEHKVDVRQTTKETLIQEWHKDFRENSEKSSLILAYSNKDINDLNQLARTSLKESGHISKDEFTYTIKKEIDDDFGGKHTIQEEKIFSKGDRILFTRNTNSLNVKNGTMGTITSLNAQKIQVTLDEGRDISFAPNLNPYFDQGWAVSIHKSQGTTVDKAYVLASYEMNQNLAYVSMTRHKEDLHIFGSSLDFWRAEKLPEVLSKSGDKLSIADYLDATSLEQLMQRDYHIITKIFNKIANELEAIGAVSKKVFWNIADHFLGANKQQEQREISALEKPSYERLSRESIREETRAEELLKPTTQKTNTPDKKPISSALKAVYEDMKHPAFRQAGHYKRVFKEGLKRYGEEGAIQYWQSRREPFLKMYEQKLEAVEHELKSPLLSYFSDEARELARKTALDDPDKTLKFLSQVQAVKQAEIDERTRETKVQDSLEQYAASYRQHLALENEKRTAKIRESFYAYNKFKDLKREYEDTYDRSLKKEMWQTGKIVFEHKEVFDVVQKIDPNIGKEIQRMSQMKEQELSLNLSRGGRSR